MAPTPVIRETCGIFDPVPSKCVSAYLPKAIMSVSFFCAVDLGRVYLDVDDRCPVKGVQPPDLQDIPLHIKQVDHAERDRVRAVR